jgi:hypothetical protein
LQNRYAQLRVQAGGLLFDEMVDDVVAIVEKDFDSAN